MSGGSGSGHAPGNVVLSPPQQAAVAHVETVASENHPRAVRRLGEVLAAAGAAASPVSLCERVRQMGRITLNFHPDRLVGRGSTVAQLLLEEGIYRNQFETRISNGGLTAFPGGDRDEWERRMFGGVYHAAGVLGADRPRYGGLDLMGHPDGACPRFGSTYFRITEDVLDRATYSYGDSVHHPEDVGTITVFSSVLAATLEDGYQNGRILGRPIEVVDFVDTILAGAPSWSEPAAETANAGALDEYVEAQIHGPVEIARDVEALVADPSFQGTRTGEYLQKMARRYGVSLDWHRGFGLLPQDIPSRFRTADLAGLAERIVEEFSADGRLDAAVVGRAARSIVAESPKWAGWGSEQDVLQRIKYLWHALVRYGAL